VAADGFGGGCGRGGAAPMAPGGAWTNDSGRLQLMNLCGSRDEKCIFHNKLKESGHVGSQWSIRFFN